MNKTIVTGVDGSETAAAAARKAAELARALDAELLVISAFGKLEIERFSSGGEEFVISNEKDAYEVAAAAVRDLKADFADVTMKPMAWEGKPADALVSAAQPSKVELIVVGNKRLQGVSRVLGSIGRDVVQNANCDVYIVYTHER